MSTGHPEAACYQGVPGDSLQNCCAIKGVLCAAPASPPTLVISASSSLWNSAFASSRSWASAAFLHSLILRFRSSKLMYLSHSPALKSLCDKRLTCCVC